MRPLPLTSVAKFSALLLVLLWPEMVSFSNIWTMPVQGPSVTILFASGSNIGKGIRGRRETVAWARWYWTLRHGAPLLLSSLSTSAGRSLWFSSWAVPPCARLPGLSSPVPPPQHCSSLPSAQSLLPAFSAAEEAPPFKVKENEPLWWPRLPHPLFSKRCEAYSFNICSTLYSGSLLYFSLSWDSECSGTEDSPFYLILQRPLRYRFFKFPPYKWERGTNKHSG